MKSIKKIAASVSVLIGVFILLFFLFYLLGDPTDLIAGQNADIKTKEAIKKELGLHLNSIDRMMMLANDYSPISIYKKEEYAKKKISGIAIGKNELLVIKWPYLGISFHSKKPVAELVANAFPATALLALTSLFFAIFLGIPLGILAALKQSGKIDKIILTVTSIGISAPSFFLSILIAYLFGFLLHAYSGLDFIGSMYRYNAMTGFRQLDLKNLFLPAVSLGIRPLTIIVQMTRSSVLDVLQMEYIKTAKSKGLTRRKIITQHILPNAINPVITSISGWLAELLAGAFFVEYIFGWQGMGLLTIGALERLDFPVVFACILFSAFLFIIITHLTDLFYTLFDPRIK